MEEEKPLGIAVKRAEEILQINDDLIIDMTI